MEVRSLKVDDFLARRIPNVGVLDIPLARDRPVEHLRPGWNFVNLQGNMLLEAPKRLTNSISSDASADRKQFRNKPVHFDAGPLLTLTQDRLNVSLRHIDYYSDVLADSPRLSR
jgi:hypothetical protein